MDEADAYTEPCGQCAAVDWGVSDEGRFYCRTCHNVIERITQAVDEHFEAGSHKAVHISKGVKHKKPAEDGRQWMVCEGFQFILKSQAEALLKLGVCPQFKDDVLCQLWRLYLQKSRQAYTNNPVRVPKFKVHSRDPESDSAAESAASAGDTDTEGDRSSVAGSARSGNSSDGWSSACSGSSDASSYLTPRQRRSRGLMSLPKTLALCHLALLWAREALTLADLLRLVYDGHIPYLNAYEGFPDEMRLYGRDALIFRVESIPSHRALRKEAHGLAVYLGLPAFPSITQHCLLHPALLTIRYLADANLPDELHDWVCRVMEQAGVADESVTYEPKSGSVLPLYDVQAAALIIVTMKLLFKLDDHTEWTLSNGAGERRKKTPGTDCFNTRKWLKVIQPALTRAKETQQRNIARKQWKALKPLYPSKKDKSVVLKRRRVAEQLQMSFQRLSGSARGPPPSSPASFRFCWGDSEGADGPSLHHKKLDNVVSLQKGVLNPEYWHPLLRACKDGACRSHYEEVEATLPKSYVWLLELFSFILGVKPASVYEEVLKVERRFLKNHKSRSVQRETSRRTKYKARKANPKKS